MIEPKKNCPTCGAPDTFLTAANEWRDMARQAQAKLSEIKRELEKLLPRCTGGAGEDNPAGYRACVWCGIVEGPASDFHRSDCPVIKLYHINHQL